jgi:CRISPR-associated protein (TIGR03986 family)
MITAPFNFVPLSEKVFFPSWAEDVSHDIPFQDGESGAIDITITAKSPIFIRDHKKEEEFCQHNGEYYIPSTSVKGMVRNVLEIMSFSKMKTDKKKASIVSSVRDMTNSMILVGTATGCGFLKKDSDNNWIIEDYGKPRTIQYTNLREKTIENIDEVIHCNFETAKEKYQHNALYKQIKIKKDSKEIARNGIKIGTKNIATISNNGEYAYLILTGSIDNKKNEFVFALSDKNSSPIKGKEIDVAVEKFKQVYFESDSVDGAFWKKNFDPTIGIPIFYMQDKTTKKITDIGLTQLFKLAYKQTIAEATQQNIELISSNGKNIEKLDLSETIFGAIRTGEKSLKGRVFFSHFKADSKPKKYKKITTILGSPNSSFYPEYIKQKCQKNGIIIGNNYKTLMDSDAKIAGWKHYPLHYGKPKIKECDVSDSSTTFIPLGSYSGDKFNEFSFKGKVRFHNLKKFEIGALVSALTFHDNQDEFYHNIGMAKSLGLGKIKISLETEKYKEHLQEYELILQEWLQEKNSVDWIKSPQIRELFVMHYKNLNIDDQLRYLLLDPDRQINEFVDKKNKKVKGREKGRECLPQVSELFDMSEENYPSSLLSEDYIVAAQERLELQRQLQAQLKMYHIVKESKDIVFIENFLKEYPDSKYAKEVEKHLSLIKENVLKKQQEEEHIILEKKYQSILKLDRNIKEKALEKFVQQHSEFNKRDEAIEELEKIRKSNTTTTDFDLSNFTKFKPLANNIKKISGNKPLTESQKDILETKLIVISKIDKIKNFKPKVFEDDNLLGKERVLRLQENF